MSMNKSRVKKKRIDRQRKGMKRQLNKVRISKEIKDNS